MMVGPLEGRLLAVLVRSLGARRILELGTFTGYSSISMALALQNGGQVITTDVNEETTGDRASLRRGSRRCRPDRLPRRPRPRDDRRARGAVRPRLHRRGQGELRQLLRSDAAVARRRRPDGRRQHALVRRRRRPRERLRDDPRHPRAQRPGPRGSARRQRAAHGARRDEPRVASRVAGSSSLIESRTTSASRSTSSGGGNARFGIATTNISAAWAERMPLAESSIAAQSRGSTSRRLAASR